MISDDQRERQAYRDLGHGDGMAWAMVYIKSEMAMLNGQRPNPRHVRKARIWHEKKAMLERLYERCDAARRDAHAAYDDATKQAT